MTEARNLYDALLRPIGETTQKQNLIIVPDGQLHLVPFDALREASGRYVVETRTVVYSPSATSFYLLSGTEASANSAQGTSSDRRSSVFTKFDE